MKFQIGPYILEVRQPVVRRPAHNSITGRDVLPPRPVTRAGSCANLGCPRDGTREVELADRYVVHLCKLCLDAFEWGQSRPDAITEERDNHVY